MTEDSSLDDMRDNVSPDPTATVTFIHLSDIHFRSTTLNDPFDLDADLRLQLEADLARVRKLAGSVTGFLITGDIAFSGDPMQYDNVTHWFSRLSEIAGCSYDSIWVVPGNHDVDRRVIQQSPQTIGSYHKLLRECDLDGIDPNLEKLLRQDVTAKEVLLKPLGAYEEFAERYGCGFQDGTPYWHYQLPGSTPYAFAIRGVNSALISDESDSSSADASKLVVGRMQCQVPKDDCCLVISMCHHPLTWLRDAEAVSHLLNNRAIVQLSGHDHTFQVEEREAGLTIKAGAVHPVRRGLWQSRYNVIRMSISGPQSEPVLTIDLMPRVWVEEKDSYEADKKENSDVWSYRFRLKPCRPEAAPAKAEERPAAEASIPVSQKPDGPEPADPHRQLAFRFLTLPLLDRLQSLKEAQLLEPGDDRRGVRDLYEVAFARARERHRLARLWDEVEHRHGVTQTRNPFREEGTD